MNARAGFTADITHRFVLKTIRRHLRQYAQARRDGSPAHVQRGMVQGGLSVAYVSDLITNAEYERFNVLADRIAVARVSRGVLREAA